MTIYQQPDLYALAFSHRDFEGETAFLVEAAAQLGCSPLQSILELGAGHAPHAGAFARRDIKYIGLEIQAEMLAYGRRKWDGEPNVELLLGDMNQFTMARQVDLAIIMLGSLYYHSSVELLTHLRCVAAAIRPGGLYVMDSCVQFGDPLAAGAEHEFERTTVEGKITSRFEIELVDPLNQIYKERWRIALTRPDGSIREAESTEFNRALYPQEFKLLIDQVTELEIAAMFGSWSLDNPIRPGATITRPVIILRKRPNRISQAV